ncbi:MAG: hypothetical protein H7138_28025 [Myxococcales bacterium]|nr:hypothetical protein [Myxococcales bacterium]
MTDSRDTQRWVWRGATLAALIVGWVFIAWQNHFHLSAPLIMVCLGYLAVLATVSNLWRTGTAAVATTDEHENDSTWAQSAGALGELEREKRTLLKAIKEAEFDHQMGKLSQLDVDDMIRTYRARAIEVIKEIDRLQTGATGTPREQIMREVRARLELEAKSQKKPDPRAEAKLAAGSTSDATADAVAATDEAAAAAATSEAAEAAAELGEAKAAVYDDAQPAKTSAKSAKADAKSKKKAAAKVVDAKATASLEDEGLDADSTTTVEPKRNDPAKEATP